MTTETGPPEPSAAAAPRPRVCFLCPMCLLDDASGAAISVRYFLEALAASGWQASSFTASLFDPNGEVPFAPALGHKAADPGNAGKLLVRERGGIRHHVFLTKSSRPRNFTPEEGARMKALWERWYANNPQDVIVTFGSSVVHARMQDLARARGARIVHYLANAEKASTAGIEPGDSMICPSRFLAAHYRKTLGIEPEVLRTIMPLDRVVGPDDPAVVNAPAHRQLGFVTFMNPIPHKGLTLFVRLARIAARARPDMRFLVTEGRMPRERLRTRGMDLGTFPNVWFIPTQRDVRAIYRRTAILLVPSFWQEGFPRSVQEAQLSGLPVIGSTRGGIPEALNGGGIALDIPEACIEDYMATPDDRTVARWWEAM